MADEQQVVVGVLAEPDAPAHLAQELAADLLAALGQRHPELSWSLPVVIGEIVTPPASTADLTAAARERLLGQGWDLAICLTNLPLRSGKHTVVAQASAVHSVGLLSVPALGAVSVRRHARDLILGLVDVLVGEPEVEDAGDRRRVSRRLRELAAEPGDQQAGIGFAARLIGGNLQLLTGMVRGNRPWRLAIGLTRALTGALAAGLFAIITSDIWRLADVFGWLRLTVLAVVAVLSIAVTLIVGGNLWERPAGPGQRRQVALFNIATSVTVVLGVTALYAALFVLATVLAAGLVVPTLFAHVLGHPVHPGDYLELAWFTSSLATVGGALGASLESDEAVHEAAYTYHRAADVT